MGKSFKELKTLWYLLFLVWVLPCLGIYLIYRKGLDFKELGPYGDFVAGTIVPFLTFISFLAIVITLRLQREQLEMQRKELHNSIEEMQATREEFKLQNQTLSIQRFENTFFQMVNLHNELVNSIVLSGSEPQEGRSAFPVFNRIFREMYSNRLNRHELNDKNELERIQFVYTMFFSGYEHHLGHYFRNLYRIVKFIDQSPLDNKKDYIGIIKAQLSSNELSLLLYNGLSENGSKFLPLMKKYNVLDNLNPNSLILPNHLEVYEEI